MSHKRFLTALFAAFCAVVLFTGCPDESDDTEEGPSGKGELEKIIDEVSEIIDSVRYGTIAVSETGNGLSPGKKYVKQSDYQALDDAFNAAVQVFDNKSATQAEIDSAVSSLKSAKTAFLNAVKTVPPPPPLPEKMVKFNAPGAGIDDTSKVTGFNSGEQWLVFPIKVSLTTGTISIQANVKVISTEGHNGVGFISVDGTSRKGYMLTTPAGGRIDGTTNGGSNQGFDQSITPKVGDTYIIRSEISPGKIAHYLYDTEGTLITKKDTSTNFSDTYGHAQTDIIYAAVGGTSVANMEWSDIIITRGVTQQRYLITELLEQSVLPSFSLSPAVVRIPITETDNSITYTAKENDADVGVTVVSSKPDTVKVVSFSNGTITLEGLKAGSAIITVTHNTDSALKGTVTVTVIDFPASDGYGTLTTVYPAKDSIAAYTDGEYMITFDSPPVLSNDGYICIYDFESGNVVDTINFTDEKQTALGTSNNVLNVGNKLARVAGNSVYFTPHFGAVVSGVYQNILQYETKYYIAIPRGAITAQLNGQTFDGLSDKKETPAWSFKTRIEPTLTASIPITVDGPQNSTANFRTVYGALNAISSKEGSWTINVAPGTYTELVHYVGSANNQTITINGQGSASYGGDVVIQYANSESVNGGSGGTLRRSSFYFRGAHLVLKNVTLKNTSSRNGGNPGQSEAFYYEDAGRTMAAFNCSFISHQDTIQTKGKNWFYKCYIEGDTDYIWGTAEVCLLEDCELVSVFDQYKSSAPAILLVGRVGSTAAQTVPKGYVIFDSTVTTQNSISTYLARNAGAGAYYDQCAVINTDFINEGTGRVGGLWQSGTVYTFLAGAAQHVGMKVYKLTQGGSPLTLDMPSANHTDMTDALYNSEYNTRDKILNRVYNTTGSYQAAASVWNISSLVTAFGAP
jgi:hypothetical protein